MTAWLESLKVGDKVIFNDNQGRKLLEVTKLTPTQVVVGKSERFRKSDGWSVGGGSWNTSYIEPVTDEILESMIRERIVKFLNEFHFETLPPELQDKIKSLVDNSAKV